MNMKARFYMAVFLSSFFLFSFAFYVVAQTPQATRGVIRLKVKFKSDAGTRGDRREVFERQRSGAGI